MTAGFYFWGEDVQILQFYGFENMIVFLILYKPFCSWSILVISEVVDGNICRMKILIRQNHTLLLL